MKILHLNTYDIRGGAARAAYRIHAALRENGIQSEMIAARKDSQDSNVKAYHVRHQEKKIRFGKRLLSLQRSSNPILHSCNLFLSGIHQAINRSDADIVHLHWLGHELISIAEVKKINKPIVWTLHDMWAFCGAEHYDDVSIPGRYRKGYKRENRPATHRGRIDIDAWTWRRKRKHWRHINFNFVTPSRWLAGCLFESALFSPKKATVIPYCLNTDVFKPVDRPRGREQFNLSQDKQLILFGADGGGKNLLKGYHLLEKALEYLADRGAANTMECVVFGGKNEGRSVLKGIPVTAIKRIKDDNLLAMLYSAADAFVAPSMLDNLPNTVMEAMSCGTPCVGFRIGGIPDMIDHQKNGFIARPFKTQELAEGINWVISNSHRRNQLGREARKKVLASYHPNIIAKQYLKLYRNICKFGLDSENFSRK